jgi:hypothetical protein
VIDMDINTADASRRVAQTCALARLAAELVVIDPRSSEGGLPTFDQILGHTLSALDEAYRAIGDAQDWLRSDWSPLGSSLTDSQARARVRLQSGLAAVKREINRTKDALTSTDGE